MTDQERIDQIRARADAATTESGLQTLYAHAVEDVPWLCERLRRATDYERLAAQVMDELFAAQMVDSYRGLREPSGTARAAAKAKGIMVVAAALKATVEEGT